MTESVDVSRKTTEQNLIVLIGESEAEVTNNKNCAGGIVLLKLTVEANYWHEASRGFSATSEYLVLYVKS